MEKLKRIQELYENGGRKEVSRGIKDYVWRHYIQQPTKKIARAIYQPPSIYFHSRMNYKFNIFNEEWDLLVVLDTCRPDALKNVSEDYDFLSEIDTKWSVGAQSAEWIMNTFDESYISEIEETAYITSNPHAYTVFDERLLRNHEKEARKRIRRLRRYSVSKPVTSNSLHTYIPLYDISTDYGDLKYPSPRIVTDHAIDFARRNDPERIIVHYMPPHTPYIANYDSGEINITNEPRPTTYSSYLDNLRWGLEEVQLLLNNIDCDRAVITSDHGENFCLRSIRSDHEPGMISPNVRRVPWAITTGNDKNTYKPNINKDRVETDLNEMLKSLGYLN